MIQLNILTSYLYCIMNLGVAMFFFNWLVPMKICQIKIAETYALLLQTILLYIKGFKNHNNIFEWFLFLKYFQAFPYSISFQANKLEWEEMLNFQISFKNIFIKILVEPFLALNLVTNCIFYLIHNKFIQNVPIQWYSRFQ